MGNMRNTGKLEQFEKIIGYHFQNRNLLRQALTHSSFANERHMAKRSDNERLEFLGDAVLELMTSDYLYREYPKYSEGELTKLRASLVCEQALAASTDEIDLGKYISLGKGENLTGGRKRKSILSDAMEAVIGAIYLDGGFAGAKEFVLKFILTDIEHKQLFYDSKTILQEYVQANYEEELNYPLLGESGPDHDKQFTAAACIGDMQVGVGEGHTKKAAEQAAAYQALLKFHYKPRQEAEGKCI
ncbi:MAG: ribonuclease III [Eubacterium sp.]|nr:ribonuclease III [Eubacterium sp.]